jgi:hypothetical protein
MYTKKLLFVLCLLASSFFAHSQALETIKQEGNTYLYKGTWLLGTNLSYLNLKQTISFQSGGQIQTFSGSSEIFTGSIAAAKLVTSTIGIGGRITYINSNGFDAAVVGPLVRVYLNNNKPVIPFISGELSFNTQKGTKTGYNAGLGVAFFLNKNVSFDLTGNYGNTYSINGYAQNTVGLGSSLTDVSSNIFSLQVGLQIYLPKKKI